MNKLFNCQGCNILCTFNCISNHYLGTWCEDCSCDYPFGLYCEKCTVLLIKKRVISINKKE